MSTSLRINACLLSRILCKPFFPYCFVAVLSHSSGAQELFQAFQRIESLPYLGYGCFRFEIGIIPLTSAEACISRIGAVF